METERKLRVLFDLQRIRLKVVILEHKETLAKSNIIETCGACFQENQFSQRVKGGKWMRKNEMSGHYMLTKELIHNLINNNRMGKTRDLFKKVRDTKGTFHAKMGTIKDGDSMDLTEAEDIKKRY